MSQPVPREALDATGPAAREQDPDSAGRIVAIDGPAGAGKSTVAARIAERFGLLNLETGAMYRAFALKVLRGGLDPDDAADLEALSQATTITLEPAETGNRVLLDGIDVTSELRKPAVTEAASRVSVHPAIRSWMVSLQRDLGARGGVVMEGRDIGTAVFPDADVKIFLDASPEARSQRRYQQGAPPVAQASPLAGAETWPEPNGPEPNGREQDGREPNGREPNGAGPVSAALAALRDQMRERDERDRHRAQSPLRPAPDAVVIDSTRLTLDQVIEQVAALITARWAGAVRR